MTRWLIDGNNVMGSRPDGWWRDRSAAKARLAGQIAGWAGSTATPVVLVFDGRADARVEAAAGTAVDLRFGGAGRPGGADDVVVDEAASGDAVVTADRGLRARLPAGVIVIGPARFLAQLGPDHPDATD